MHPYLPHTNEDIAYMLKTLGLDCLENLFDDISPDLRIKNILNIPNSHSETEVLTHMKGLLKKNQLGQETLNFAGGGIYNHTIPKAVSALTSRSEFYTAYTPYQPEISQGTLQSIFEFQSMICQLTGMDASNATHYDGATATAEAVMMAYNTNKKIEVLLTRTLNPEVIAVVETYCKFRGLEVVYVNEKEGVTDFEHLESLLSDDTCAVVLSSPNYFGNIEDVSAIEPKIHETKGFFIYHTNLVALSVLKSGKEVGADVCVGDGQSIGNAMNFGGPTLGFMATTMKHLRKLPGRIVGKTKDLDGKDAYVLTLQAREQHIRRSKATSNITSNQALNALATTITLSLLGSQGLVEMAKKSMAGARYLAEGLCKIQPISKAYAQPFFNEFVITLPKAKQIHNSLIEHNICLGILIEPNKLLICVTELMDKKTLDDVIPIVADAVKKHVPTSVEEDMASFLEVSFNG